LRTGAISEILVVFWAVLPVEEGWHDPITAPSRGEFRRGRSRELSSNRTFSGFRRDRKSGLPEIGLALRRRRAEMLQSSINLAVSR
jgi:hypothetical protein